MTMAVFLRVFNVMGCILLIEVALALVVFGIFFIFWFREALANDFFR